MLLIIAITGFVNFQHRSEDQWEKVGRSDTSVTTAHYDLAKQIETNLQLNETILSNDESGFMLATLSGRKVMLTRRTHASYFVDIDQRIAQAAVAMYANDSTYTTKVLDTYNVKYWYIDQQFYQSPMRTHPKYADLLKAHNVSFSIIKDRYDIALPPERANLFDVLIIPPQAVSEQFARRFMPIYRAEVNGQAFGVLLLRNDSLLTTNMTVQ
jgi:hypothetical protein